VYLKLYFEQFDWELFAAKDEKVKGKTLNKKKLSEIPIVLPDVEIQRKIVVTLKSKLSAIDDLAMAVKETYSGLKLARRLVLSDVFSVIYR